MRGVWGLINVRAQQPPDEPAFTAGIDGRTLTWRALARCAGRMRPLAGERRLAARARIGPVIDDPLAFTAGYLRALAAGLTAGLTDPRLPSAEVATAVARLRLDVLVANHRDTGSEQPDVKRWAAGIRGPVLVRAPPNASSPSAEAAGPANAAPTTRLRAELPALGGVR